MKRLFLFRLLATTLIAVSAATANADQELTPSAQAPDLGSSRVYCTLIISGSGTYTDNESVNLWWDAVHKGLGEKVLEVLQVNSMPARLLHIPVGTSEAERSKVAGDELGQSRCSRLLQLSHSTYTRKGVGYFAFEVSLLGFEASEYDQKKKGWHASIKEFRRKQYEYTHDQKTFQTLRVGDVANRIINDFGDDIEKARDAAGG